MTIRHVEVLVEDEADCTTLRMAKATDQYVLAGSGPEQVEPRFIHYVFRYAEIKGLKEAGLSANDVRAVAVHNDMQRTGWFETSDPLLNQLHSNVAWSMRAKFVYVQTDCPQRDESLRRSGDLNACTPTAFCDVTGVLTSWPRDLALEHRHRGVVPDQVPRIQGTHETPVTLWSDSTAILLQCYDSMATFTLQCGTPADEHWLGGWVHRSRPPTPGCHLARGFSAVGQGFVDTTSRLARGRLRSAYPNGDTVRR